MKAKFQSCEDSGVKIAFKLPSGEKTCHVFSDSGTVKVRNVLLIKALSS